MSALRRILVETRIYDELGRDWFAREHPDLLLVYIQGTDSIGHVFAPYAPPRQESIVRRITTSITTCPSGSSRASTHDWRLRALAESTGSVLMLASDHGFQWGEGRPTTLSSAANATAARWHTDDGIYLLWGTGIQPSRTATRARDSSAGLRDAAVAARAAAGQGHRRSASSRSTAVSRQPLWIIGRTTRPATVITTSGASPRPGQTTKRSRNCARSATSGRRGTGTRDRHPHRRFAQQRGPAPEAAGKTKEAIEAFDRRSLSIPISPRRSGT